MNCESGSNNQYYNFPPNMNDGRNYAEWRPEAVVDATIRERHNIKTNWNYRKFLQNNSDEIIQSNQYLACDECGRCPYYNTGKIQNVPYLFRNIVDQIKPFGYETSDQKELYLSRQDLQARLFVPTADQSLLLPFKRSK